MAGKQDLSPRHPPLETRGEVEGPLGDGRHLRLKSDEATGGALQPDLHLLLEHRPLPLEHRAVEGDVVAPRQTSIRWDSPVSRSTVFGFSPALKGQTKTVLGRKLSECVPADAFEAESHDPEMRPILAPQVVHVASLSSPMASEVAHTSGPRQHDAPGHARLTEKK